MPEKYALLMNGFSKTDAQKPMNGFSKTYTTIARHLLCGMVESVIKKPMNGYPKTDERLSKNRWDGGASGAG